jgi:hypothetical protein
MVLNAASLLHAACMMQVGMFIPDDRMIARWAPLFQSRLKELVDTDRAERIAGGTLQTARA